MTFNKIIDINEGVVSDLIRKIKPVRDEMKIVFFLAVFSVFFHNVFASTDTNDCLLGQYADELVGALWNHSNISVQDIEIRLDFVNDPAACCLKSPPFELLTKKSNSFNDEGAFVEFFNVFKSYYSSLIDDNKKASLCMLFDTVMKKYKIPYKLLQKMKNFSLHDNRADYVPKFLGSADSSQPLL
ncbi:MAG: hypothetical protein FADNKDHG_01354 [Holosporales bacterium]